MLGLFGVRGDVGARLVGARRLCVCEKEGPGHLSRCGASDAERMAERLGGKKERLAFHDCQYLWVIA